MPGTDQRKGAVGAHGRLERLQVQCQTCLGKQNINVQHCLIAVLELRLDLCHLCRKCHQNALDLLSFLGAVLQDPGICLHHSLRLHKDGCTGGGYIVDDAAYFPAVFAFDRHHIPSVADGDHTLLQILGGIHIAHHAFQPVADAVLGGTDLLAQVVQGMRGSICHGIRRKDGAGYLLFQPRLRCQCVEQIVRRQCLVVRGAIPAGKVLEIPQSTCHHQQLTHGEYAALDGTHRQCTDPLYPAKPGRTVFDQQGVDGIGLLQSIPDFIRVALGLDVQQLFPCFLAHAAFGGTGDDLIQF